MRSREPTSRGTLPPLPVPDGGKEKVDDKKSPNDKVKSAKKIAKEMAKWEKKMNQRKDQSRTASEVRSEAGNSGGGKGAEDIAFNLLQRKTEDTEGSGLAGLAGYASDEEEESTPGGVHNSNMAIAELKLIDWNNLTCLLCQRACNQLNEVDRHHRNVPATKNGEAPLTLVLQQGQFLSKGVDLVQCRKIEGSAQ